MKTTLFSVLLIFVFLSGCSNNDSSNNPVAPTPSTVAYAVSGSAASVSLTYTNATGGTEQIASASLPWGKSFTAQSGAFVYVSAQNNGSAGTVTATITVNGKVLQTSTSSGAYVIATASGDVP